MKEFALTIMILFCSVLNGITSIKKEIVEYKHGETLLKGYLIYDSLLKAKRPGIVLIHDNMGINDFIQQRAENLAQDGYIIFALDMFGKEYKPQDRKEAKKKANEFYQDRIKMRERAYEGYLVLREQKNVNPDKIGAIGFSFGGTVALELVRNGAEIKCTICFHSNLDTPEKDKDNNIMGSILILLGADDPFISPEEIKLFQEEMHKKNVDWQMNIYGNAVRGFTNPDFGFDKSDGTAYHYYSDKRAWEALKMFLREHLR